jgi:phospholipase D1/2
MRQLVAFIGGLDLCDGRYDTAEHSLFRTLRTVHSEDFHQACCLSTSIQQGGAPCRALSCKIETPLLASTELCRAAITELCRAA